MNIIKCEHCGYMEEIWYDDNGIKRSCELCGGEMDFITVHTQAEYDAAVKAAKIEGMKLARSYMWMRVREFFERGLFRESDKIFIKQVIGFITEKIKELENG